jgi:uncharacterized protein with PIN domain
MDANESTILAPRFLVDENAARLVRWLRLIGYDAISVPGADDAALVDHARRDVRWLLTRDRGIIVRRPVVAGDVQAVLLESDDTWLQLEQVVQSLHLDPDWAPFSRCVVCNEALESVPLSEAITHVPPFVGATQQSFTRCPSCGRYYWRGTHWRRVNDRLAGLPRYHAS